MKGTPALIAGELGRPVRSEAEFRSERAAKPVVKCNAGETVDSLDRCLLQEAYDRAMLAKRAYIAAMEDANMGAAEIELATDTFSDLEGDTWRPAIERMGS